VTDELQWRTREIMTEQNQPKADPAVKLERVEPADPKGSKWFGGAKPPSERKSIKEDPSGKSNSSK
jgi:hypothetical protein